MRVTKTRARARAMQLVGLLLLLAAAGAYGRDQSAREVGITLKNECRPVGHGLYQCVVYLEAGGDVLDNIDDVRYTLPYGYENHKHTAGRGRRDRPFSSNPFNTTEEVTVNVKIDFKRQPDVYLSHRVRLSNEKLN